MQAEYSRLTQQVMPRTEEIYQKLIGLYTAQQQELDTIDNRIYEVMGEFAQKIKESQSYIGDLNKTIGKDATIINKGEKYIDAKNEEMKNKNKIVESIISGLKETVSKIKPSDLAELPVDKERSLQNTFKMLFKVLYSEKDSNFVWKDFKSKALKFEDGEDFQSRLANINVRMISKDDYLTIKQLKGDPEFEKLCENPKYSTKLIDLGDWMEYVCAGYQFQSERDNVGKDKDKILADINKRTKVGREAQDSLNFWRESKIQAEEFQNNLQNIQSRLKTIKIGLEQSLPKLQGSLEQSKVQFSQLPKA